MKRRYLFQRFLFSYLLILVIPMSILLLLIRMRSAEETRIEELRHIEQAVNYSIDLLKREFVDYSTIVDAIAGDPQLTAYNLMHSAVDMLTGITELGKYTRTHSQIKYTMLYYREIDKMVMANGVESLPTFFRHEVPHLDVNRTLFDQLLRTPADVCLPLFDAGNAGRCMLVFFYPLPVNFRTPTGTFVCFIEVDFFRDLFATVLVPDSGIQCQIVDQDRAAPLFKIDEEPFLMRSGAGPDGGEWSLLNHGGERYWGRTFPVNHFDWEIEVLVPLPFINSVTSEKIFYLFIFSGAVFIAGIILIAVSMRLYYRPQHRFLQDLARLSGKEMEQSPWEQAELFYLNLARENRRLLEKAKKEVSVVRDGIVLDILRGEFDDPDELNERCREYGIALKGDSFFAVFFIIHNAGELDKRRIIENIESLLPGEICGYGKDRSDRDLIPFVCSCRGGDRGNLPRLFSGLIDNVNRKYRWKLAAAVGSIVSSPGEFDISRQKALAATRYQQLYKRGDVQFYDDMAAEGEDLGRINENFFMIQDDLLKCVVTGDSEAFDGSLERLIGIIRNASLNPIFTKNFMYIAFNPIYKFILESDMVSREEAFGIVRREIPMGFESIEQFRSTMRELFELINEKIVGSRKSSALLSGINAYIEENFHKYDFSVETMARHFGVSRSYLSRLYRAHYGQTLAAAIRTCRLEQGKRLLLENRYSVEEVAHKIGYGDVSHFIKIFRKWEGTTPKKYCDLRSSP